MDSYQVKQIRVEYLTSLATKLTTGMRQGLFTKVPVTAQRVSLIPGPRTGIVHIEAGYYTDELLNNLTGNPALLRQMLWDKFEGPPVVYLHEKGLRVEAGWPSALTSTNIYLSELHEMKPASGRFTVGPNIMGQTVVMSFDDTRVHSIIGGTTGSGKSVLVKSMVYQLSMTDQLVLVDGKPGGDATALRDADRLKNVVGPLAVRIDDAQKAAAWAVSEMIRRYEQRLPREPRVILVIDELQEFSADPIFVELIRMIFSQGRACGIHCVIATQYPTVEVLGDPQIKRNTGVRFGLRTTDDISSRAVMGQPNPRLDYLLGAGDAWVSTVSSLHRVQIAQVVQSDFEKALKYKPQLEEWPELYDSLRNTDVLEKPVFSKATGTTSGTRAIQFSGEQIGWAVVYKTKGYSRADLIRKLEELRCPVARKTSARLWEIADGVIQTMAEASQERPTGRRRRAVPRDPDETFEGDDEE